MEQNPVLGFYRRYSPWTIPFCVITLVSKAAEQPLTTAHSAGGIKA